MKWIVRALDPKHHAQTLPPSAVLGSVDAPDKDDALRVARIAFGDRLGLHVQSAISAAVAESERDAVARHRLQPKEPSHRSGWVECRNPDCDIKVRKVVGKPSPKYCGPCSRKGFR